MTPEAVKEAEGKKGEGDKGLSMGPYWGRVVYVCVNVLQRGRTINVTNDDFIC